MQVGTVTLYDLSRYWNCPRGFALVLFEPDLVVERGILWLLAVDLTSVVSDSELGLLKSLAVPEVLWVVAVAPP